MPADEGPAPELGAVAGLDGVRFSVFSESATAVELSLFDGPDDPRPARRLALEPRAGGIWTRHVAGARPGQLYGYRVDGPHRPEAGHRFDPDRLLIDPYARAVSGEPGVAGTADGVPKSIVVDDRFDWGEDAPPLTPWSETVIYECHVGGLTRLHPEVPEALRGTYLGLVEPAVLEHLHRLGVTAVQLMPVQQFTSEPFLRAAGRVNYFGYNPLALFAPHAGYATVADGGQVDEFRRMVRALHAAGLEVILDVVFNHTAEGGPEGPTLSWRGFDNRAYYRLDPADPRRYVDFSGCGNTLDGSHPAVERMILDCLRTWAGSMRVDGFRFDLATSLGRDAEGAFAPDRGLLRRIGEDPVLSRLELIAEPWDLGPHGYQAGRFPAGWREWNDAYRDAARGFWRGDRGSAAPLAEAMDGSGRRFGSRAPAASIAFVTSHDGFTLADLVAYERKHNEANGEDNRDGSDHNLSRNWGVEGPTDSPEILERRRRVSRALAATLALSRGVPMLSHGDELGRTQDGNNNAYCHDSRLTWVDWRPRAERAELTEYLVALFRLRRELGLGAAEPIAWIGADGQPIDPAAAPAAATRRLGGRLRGPGGEAWVLLNAGERAALFVLPLQAAAGRWWLLLGSAGGSPRRLARTSVRLPAHSLSLLRFEASET